QAEDGIRDLIVTGVQTCALPILGEHYRIPYDGANATGLGKPLKLMARPLRYDLPIWLAAIGPKNVKLAAEIADGWLPIFFDPDKIGRASCRERGDRERGPVLVTA